MSAMEKATLKQKNRKSRKKQDLIVLRINKSGSLCESAPCYHCTKELNENPNILIDTLYFSRSDGTISSIKFTDWLKKEHTVSKGWKWLSLPNSKKKNVNSVRS